MKEHSKFVRWIADAKFPKKLKMPSSVKKYEGLKDPDDHLFEFFTAARLEQWSEETWCHMFVQTLTGIARVWYDALPNGQIQGFEELRTKFLRQFSQQKKCTKAITEIHNIRRLNGESIEDFVVRFNNESMNITGAQDQLRVSGFCHGVKNSQLVEKLHEDLPVSMEVLMDRVRAFVKGKSATGSMQAVPSQKSVSRVANGRNENLIPVRHNTWNRFKFQDYNRRRDGNDPRRYWDRKNSYPNLTKTPSEILATENVRFSLPFKQKVPANADLSKYCEYHRDKGHNTDDCRHLKQEIEKAIKSGKLSHLVKNIKDGTKANASKISISVVRRKKVFWERSVRSKFECEEEWMRQEITFPPLFGKDSKDDPVVITIGISGFLVKRIYIDTGSASEIMYEDCFERMGDEVRQKLRPCSSPLVGFSGEVVQPIGEVTLPVIVGDDILFREVMMTFLVVRASSPHNVIIGRPGLRMLGAAVSTALGMIRFPTPKGIATVKSDGGKQITMIEQKQQDEGRVIQQNGQNLAENKWVINNIFPDQTIEVGPQLESKTRAKLFKILKDNVDVFAWQPLDMTGVPRHLSEHVLNVYPNVKPVQQKKRIMDKIRSEVVLSEVQKLVEADILREVQYQTWVANPVLVKKGDGTWRMCIDFKNLNDACPKDCYPLPEIDLKVDALAGFRLKCFLDAYKGYHQILMAEGDEDKTAFITNDGLYCYKKMPFGLKNAGATYQRLMDKAFKNQVGRNVEAYVDDVVIKSTSDDNMIEDILETFATLKDINMKLNPKKCAFGMEEGKFLGVFVSKEGIQAYPRKVEAILKMKTPSSVKEIQTLNGRLVSLHRFLSKAAERTVPFMMVLKESLKANCFKWTAEANAAFEELKKFLTMLPTLTAPIPGEELIMYLAVASKAVSAVLLVERDQRQIPIFYVSKVLKEYETRYPSIEKVILALVQATRRLRRYFQAHSVIVLTSFPIQAILRRPEMSGRMIKWAIELGPFDIGFKPRTSIKGQILADFLTEVSQSEEANATQDYLKGEVLHMQDMDSSSNSDASDANAESVDKDKISGNPWHLYTDGSSNSDGSGAGVVLTSPEGDELTYAVRFKFKTSNNEAEYEALLLGLRIAKQLGANKVIAHTDSLLVASQAEGSYEAKGEYMALYLKQVQLAISWFDTCEILHVPRGQNRKADALSKLASISFEHLAKEIRVEVLEKPTVLLKEVHTIQFKNDGWMKPIVDYLKEGKLPSDKEQARKIRVNALQYQLQEGQLYRRTFLGPLLRCLTSEEADYVVREVHEGICGIHSGTKMVVAKIMGIRYYWPGMYQTTMKELQKCIECQKHSPISLRAKNELIPVTSAWPFQKWGMDIVGPFPISTGGVKFLLVAIDYFPKWVEAKPLATISGNQVKKFVWEQVVCRYGLPLIIISDNGRQFAENPFKQWCEDLHITQVFTSVAHPQANGQVERANRSIVEGIKMRLEKYGGSWIDEVPHVLWAHRTMPKTSNGETPFSLTYGTEAVIPAEIGMGTHRMSGVDDNDHELRLNLDLIEERREIAAIRESRYKKEIAKYYNANAKVYQFKVGEFVLRNNEASKAVPLGKMAPKWEGPYKVSAANANGSYILQKFDGSIVPRSWNGIHLRKCYM